MSAYEKLEQREHVLRRPGMYVGSTAVQEEERWVWRGGAMSLEAVRICPALAQVFLEVLTNAVDHSLRARVPEVSVTIEPGCRAITVRNGGPGIDTSATAAGVRGPELVFGHLLSSSNFADGGDRRLAGQNGLGVKLCNIFSRRLEVETVDAAARPPVLYRQSWADNMSVCSEPEMSRPAPRQKPYTCVRFEPDLQRLGGGEPVGEGAMAAMRKLVVDAAAAVPAGTAVLLDGVRLPGGGLRGYCELFPGVERAALAVDSPGPDWEVAVACSDGGFRQVSFVNGLCTPNGGKHVDHVASALCRRLAARMSTKARPVTQRAVRSCLWLFVRCSVPDPTFDSQNKHTLTTPPEMFGSRYEPGDAMLRAVLSKTGLPERVARAMAQEDESKLRRSDGTRRRTVTGVQKLEDASAAGGPESGRCTLLLSEGNSAMTTCIAGLSAVGRRHFGVYALRGKPLNVRDAPASRITANQEIKDLKRVLGLEAGRDYSAPEARACLRYGRVLVATDSDHDGHHIAMLVANLFHALWPSLLAVPGFLQVLRTPVVLSCRGAERLPFFTAAEFESWRATPAASAYTHTYIKGLGLLSSEDARRFIGADRRTFPLVCRGDEASGPPALPAVGGGVGGGVGGPGAAPALKVLVSACGRVTLQLPGPEGGDGAGPASAGPVSDDDAMRLAFSKSRAQDRKAWINSFDRRATLEEPPSGGAVPLAHYVDRLLAHYSLDDVLRSLPSAVDGLKDSLRKVAFAALERPRGAGHIRVAQMAAYVGQVSAYRHGEASLQGAVVGMAQAFVGCGHAPLLTGEGQFGSRIMGGKDAASPRYIHCDIAPITRLLLHPDDEPLLQRNLDDAMAPIEPVNYAPVLPLLLLNGSSGIGTGYSTNVPCVSPSLVAGAYRRRIAGDPGAIRDALGDPEPCYPGFRGTFPRGEGEQAGKIFSQGLWERRGRQVRVTELPIGTWSADYRQFLEDFCAARAGTSFRSEYTDTEVDFTVVFPTSAAAEACDPPSDLRLRSDRGMSRTNMHAIDPHGRVRLYATPADIAEAHFDERLHLYGRRLVHLTRSAESSLAVARAKEEFVRDVTSRAFDIQASEDAVERQAAARGWPRCPDLSYLTSMPMGSMTVRRHERLVRDVREAEARLARLRSSTPESLWLADIDRLCAAAGWD